jgi:hypothetical protein
MPAPAAPEPVAAPAPPATGENPEYRIDLEYRIDQAIKRAEALDTVNADGSGKFIWTLERRGDWLWLTGNTYPIKDALAAAGYSWSKSHTLEAQRRLGNRKAGVYTWKPEEYGKWHRRQHTDDETIKAKYGSREVL